MKNVTKNKYGRYFVNDFYTEIKSEIDDTGYENKRQSCIGLILIQF